MSFIHKLLGLEDQVVPKPEPTPTPSEPVCPHRKIRVHTTSRGGLGLGHVAYAVCLLCANTLTFDLGSVIVDKMIGTVTGDVLAARGYRSLGEHLYELQDNSTVETEWGIVVDDNNSTEIAEDEAEARQWLKDGKGHALVRIVTRRWEHDGRG